MDTSILLLEKVPTIKMSPIRFFMTSLINSSSNVSCWKVATPGLGMESESVCYKHETFKCSFTISRYQILNGAIVGSSEWHYNTVKALYFEINKKTVMLWAALLLSWYQMTKLLSTQSNLNNSSIRTFTCTSATHS